MGKAAGVTDHAHAEETRFEGEPAVELAAGAVTATFVPDLGMTGVSLRHRGRERLSLPGGLDTLRAGRTTGLPLLAPWANRLSRWRYTVAGVEVDLDGLPLRLDGDTGLPIHGLVVGQPGWTVDALVADGAGAELRASRPLEDPAFPFPHRLDVTARAGDDRLRVDTTITPTGDRPVPIAIGWHPYLALPEAPRSAWRLRVPARTHMVPDERGIPTGAREPAPAEDRPLGDRTYDDLYELGDERHLAFALDDGTAVELHAAAGYPFAQVWVPPGQPFAALEPMAAPTDALVAGTAPTVAPGDAFTATFALVLS
jgi:galactose mutarotase-like enzyme